MKKSANISTSSISTTVAAFSSLIVPGLGQFLLKKRQRGLVIFFAAVVSVYLVDWSFVHQNIGKINLGGWVTSLAVASVGSVLGLEFHGLPRLVEGRQA